MRTLLIALIVLALPTLAHAACEHPAKPAFPDPKTAAPAAVQDLDQKMQKYSAGMTAYIQCLAREAETAQTEAKDTITAYNQKFLAEYNKRATAPAQ